MEAEDHRPPAVAAPRRPPEASAPARRWWLAGALLVLAALAGTWYLWHFTPGSSGWFPECLFHRVTGLYCPGCGSTRAVHCLLHGQWRLALQMNPLIVFTLPTLAYLVLWQMVYSASGRRLPYPRVFDRTWLQVGLVGFVLLFAILRNLPVYPCTLLAPP